MGRNKEKNFMGFNPLFKSIFNEGEKYFYDKNYDLAIKCWEKIPKSDAYYYNSQFNIGLSHLQKGDHDKAIEYLETVPKNNKNYYSAQLKIGLTYSYKDEDDKAIEYFESVPKNNENYDSSQYGLGLGLVYAAKDEHSKAIEYFKAVLKNNENYFDAQYYLDLSLIELNQYKEAEEHYIKWVTACIKNNIVDYTTSMNIYQIKYLLLKQKDKTEQKEITEINELTKEYIKKIVESEHNKNEEEIKKYSTKSDYNKEALIKDNDGKIILYQYGPYNKNTIYKIKHGQMYFSDPLTFNDPFDPLIRVLDKNHSEGLIKLLNFRVSCLSPEIDNLLLWSHYADKHQGICVAYDITELLEKDNIIFRKIEYIEDPLPKPQLGLIFVSLIRNTRPNKSITLINTFTKKDKAWDYEKEYRLIRQLETGEEKEFLPEVEMKAIYLGRDMPEKDKEFIDNMITEKNSKTEDTSKHIKVYYMEISDNDIFKLEKKRI